MANIPFIESGCGHFDKCAALLDPNKVTHVYKNLHKKCWSVKQSGRVVLHTDYICLRDCKFVVNQKGRDKVIATKQKNVHATVRGYFINPRALHGVYGWDDVTYNPYKDSSFINQTTFRPALKAEYVDMMIDKAGQFVSPVIAYGVKS